MVVTRFPSVEQADRHGLLAIGGDLDAESLLCAYRRGIFPWPLAGEDDLLWFAPDPRAVLFFSDFHLPKSLRKELRQTSLRCEFNRACGQVIQECADTTNRSDSGTWITASMIEAYTRLHELGFCHSVECYDGEELVGGLYGVMLGRMFAGESMFYRRPNASKLCLSFLIEHLKSRGASWIDCQQMTPLMRQLGATEIARPVFMELLNDAVTAEPILL